MAEKKDYSLPYPKIKKEDKGWKAYFKIYNSKGIKSNTNGGWYEHKTDAENNALERQRESIKRLTEKKKKNCRSNYKRCSTCISKRIV